MESMLKELYISFLTETQKIYLGDKKFDDFIDHFLDAIRSVDGIFPHFSEDEMVLYVFCEDTDDMLLSMQIDSHYESFNMYTSSEQDFVIANAKKVGYAALYLLQAYTEWNMNVEKEKTSLPPPKSDKDVIVKYHTMLDPSELDPELKKKLDLIVQKDNKLKKEKLSKLKGKKYKITIIGTDNGDEDSIDDWDLEWI